MKYFCTGFCASVVTLASTCSAETWQSAASKVRAGPHAPLKPCKLEYRLSWRDSVNAGSIVFEFAPPDAKKAGKLVCRGRAKSTGAAAALYPYGGSFWSEMQPGSHKSLMFHSTETRGREATELTNRFGARGVESIETESKPKKAPKTTNRNFSYTPVSDVFAAMLLVRSQSLANGDMVRLALHPFDNPYMLRVKVLGREAHAGRAAIKLQIGLNKIHRGTMKLLPYKKLTRDAILWLSDDAERIPLEFRAPVFIGDIRATLLRHESYR